MKLLVIHIPGCDVSISKDITDIDIDDVYVIANEEMHLDGRKEILLKNDATTSEILSKCASFSDADFIFINAKFIKFHIDNEMLSELENVDAISFYSTFNDVRLCGAFFIRVEILKNSTFNRRYEYVFDYEIKSRIEESRFIEKPSIVFPIDEDSLNAALLELEAFDISARLCTGNKNIIYTACDDVSSLPSVDAVNSNFDYVCFTHKMDKDAYPWEMIRTEYECEVIKLHPEYFLSNYDTSLWVDPRSKVKNDLNDIMSLLNSDEYILVADDVSCDCVYDAISRRNDIESKKFKVALILDKYPIKMGMIDSYFILRRHNSEECQKMMNAWHYCMMYANVEDDICFNYAFWKMKGRYMSIPFQIASQRFIRK